MNVNTIAFLHVLIGQVKNVDACSSPNPIQWLAIIALIGAAGIFTVSTGVGVVAVATTIITLIGTGASVAAIAAALADQVGITISSLEVLSSLVYAIRLILGC